MRLRSFVLVLVTVVPAATSAQANSRAPGAPARFSSAAVTSAAAMTLDGHLTEEVWQRTSVIDAFVQREPHEGAEPSFRTEVRVAQDTSSLYVAVRAFDPEPDRIVGMLTRRDDDSPSDWIRVFVDSYYDRRSAYEFAVNAAGVKQDRYWFNDNNDDPSWDAIWDVVVRTDEQGWGAEFRIPYSQLRFDSQGAGRVGFAVGRIVARLNETSSWPLLPRSASGFVSSFGELTGVSAGVSSNRLELVPYTVAQLATERPEAGNPLAEHRDPGAALGLDLKYALTPGLTLTATVNPDFGQVEADPAVVNLTAFETFFAERRPFFVEGGGIFRFDMDCNDGECSGLFYSRRVGRSPHGDPDVPEGGFSRLPVQTTILGAAKLTGRVGRFSVGALNALTAREEGVVATASSRDRLTVEPATSYSVLRMRREFADRSSLGFMTTATNRRIDEHVTFVANHAYTGGIDWDWRLGSRYNIAGYVAGSSVRGSAEAIQELQESNVHSFQRPDAAQVRFDPTRRSLEGYAADLAVNKLGGERVRFSSEARFKSPGFDANDLGFMRRADERNFFNWLQWRRDRPSRFLRSFRLNFNQWSGWNYDGDRLSFGGNVNAHWTFQNNWRAGGGITANGRRYDDRLTRGGPGGFTEGRRFLWSYVETDDRRPLQLAISGELFRDAVGSSGATVNPRVNLRPSAALSLSAGFRYRRNIDDAQWIENVGEDSPSPHYLFGRLDQRTFSVTTRVNYTVSPNLSLQLYAEPFVSAGIYDDLRELVNGRAPRYEDRYRPFAYEQHAEYENPDFNIKSFRTTNVLRWEYRPGSTLFVVWQQEREDEIDGGREFRLGRDFGDIFSVGGRNVFLVKLAYWLNM